MSNLPHGLRIYAFGAALGGQRVLDAATVLASQSGLPERNLTLTRSRAASPGLHPTSSTS